MLDLDAPIKPGTAAGGFRIGDDAEELVTAGQPHARETRIGCDVLDFGSVRAWIRDGAVRQICVRGAYRGCLDGGIAVGSTLAEAVRALGPVTKDDESNLVVAGIAGLCFDTGPWRGLRGFENIEQNMDATITEICVFAVT